MRQQYPYLFDQQVCKFRGRNFCKERRIVTPRLLNFTLFTSMVLIRVLPSSSLSLQFNWCTKKLWRTTISNELFVREKCDDGKNGKFSLVKGNFYWGINFGVFWSWVLSCGLGETGLKKKKKPKPIPFSLTLLP